MRLHGKIDLDGVGRDRDQLWAEAVEAEAKGESLVIAEALWADAAIAQGARMEVDEWADIIGDKLRVLETNRGNLDGLFATTVDTNCVPEFRVSSQYLLNQLLGISESNVTHNHARRVADVMRSLGWRRAENSIRVGKKSCRAYVKPIPDKDGDEC